MIGWCAMITLALCCLAGAMAGIRLLAIKAARAVANYRATNAALRLRVTALEGDVARLRAAADAFGPRNAAFTDDAARAALVDALQCAVDSLSYARQTQKEKTADAR